MHLNPRRRNVAAQVAEELKTGHIRYPSYGGTQKERKYAHICPNYVTRSDKRVRLVILSY